MTELLILINSYNYEVYGRKEGICFSGQKPSKVIQRRRREKRSKTEQEKKHPTKLVKAATCCLLSSLTTTTGWIFEGELRGIEIYNPRLFKRGTNPLKQWSSRCHSDAKAQMSSNESLGVTICQLTTQELTGTVNM